MNVIGKLADTSNGDVDLVDPITITQNFGSILESKLIATDVNVKLFLHKGFTFPDSLATEWKVQAKKNYAERNIGNAYEDTEITAEFTSAPAQVLSGVFSEMPEPVEKDEKILLPFQVQIRYTALNGMKCTRVVTKTKEVTNSVEEVEKEVDINVLGIHANWKTACLAQQGQVVEAIELNEQLNDIMSKNCSNEMERESYGQWKTTTESFNNQILKHQVSEPVSNPLNNFADSVSSFGNFISNKISSFNFGPQPSQVANNPMYLPSGNNSVNPLHSGGEYTTTSSNSGYVPTSFDMSSVMQHQQQKQQMEEDDEMSNTIYNRRNAQKNKRQWTSKRKY